jgi:hypothetical protein
MDDSVSIGKATGHPSPSRNQGQQIPRLPGGSMPAGTRLPVAYIYRPAPSATQSGLAQTKKWVLEFEPWNARRVEPLMGWTSSRDPFASIALLRFPNRQSAIDFAERQGLPYVIRDPRTRRFRPKRYVDNFKRDPSGAMTQARWPPSGTVSSADRLTPSFRKAGSIG